MKASLLAKAATALAAGTALALAGAFAASAHVTVTPNTAPAGSTAVLTFTVPNESATAKTDRVEINLPEATPFAGVSYIPTPGWTTKLVSSKLAKPVILPGETITDAITQIVITADHGHELGEGQAQDFAIRVEGVPDTAAVAISVTQHYTDGTVARWNSFDAAGDDPAPQLFVNAQPPATQHGHGATAGSGPSTPLVPEAPAPPDVVARVLGGIGLLLGAVALVIAVAGRRRGSEA